MAGDGGEHSRQRNRETLILVLGRRITAQRLAIQTALLVLEHSDCPSCARAAQALHAATPKDQGSDHFSGKPRDLS